MAEFMGFMMIVFAGIWGSVFLSLVYKRLRGEIESSPDDRMLSGVRDELETLSSRLMRMEEEMDFLRALNDSGSRGMLPSSSEEAPSTEEPTARDPDDPSESG